jgi:hypothetical protein
MKFLKFVLLASFTLACLSTNAQSKFNNDTLENKKYWTKGATFGLQFTQSSFYQWVAGGQNSITIAGLSKSYLKYSKGKIKWENTLDINYGMIKQGKKDLIKSDDRFELNSAFGKQAIKKWYYSGQLNFRSQFAPGYLYTDSIDTKISDFLAPAYLTLSLGMEYKPKKDLSLLISPIAGKTTLVYNNELAAQGLFGLTAGKNIRNEFGGLIRFSLKEKIMKNVELTTNLSLYSNYIENPENIDVNWDALVVFKVNKYLNFNLNVVMIYDHDIVVPKDRNGDGNIDGSGIGLQLKEVFGLGFTYAIDK